MGAAREERHTVRWLLLGVLASVAALHLAITLSTLLGYTLQHPFHDEFRGNLFYLTVPFPFCVLLLDNGHRPIFPGIVRYLDLWWFGGTRVLQAATAWGAALAITLALVRDGVRHLSRVLAAAAVCLICALLWWNANARMFIHVYEATNLFFVALGLVVALWCAHAAVDGRRVPWAIAILACVVATFSFGPGIATFAVLFVAGVLLRQKAARLVVVVAAALAASAIYFFLLPGSYAALHESTGFSPLGGLYYLAARLAAPAYELLSGATPQEEFSPAWTLVGLIVLLPVMISVVRRWHGRVNFDRFEIVAVGLFCFGVTASYLVAATRADYFAEHPDQIFAERYLFWSCLAWLGAGLYGLASLNRMGSRAQSIGALAVGALAIAGVPAAIARGIWAAEVYRRVELTAAGLSVGLRDDARVLEVSDAGLEMTYRAVEAMRIAGTGGFGSAGGPSLGQVVPVSGERPHQTAFLRPGTTADTIVGALSRQAAWRLRNAPLWLAAGDGTLVGRAALTWSSREGNRLRIGIPILDRFDGYLTIGLGRARWLGRLQNGVFVVVAEFSESVP